jgi:hypothetical protein
MLSCNRVAKSAKVVKIVFLYCSCVTPFSSFFLAHHVFDAFFVVDPTLKLHAIGNAQHNPTQPTTTQHNTRRNPIAPFTSSASAIMKLVYNPGDFNSSCHDGKYESGFAATRIRIFVRGRAATQLPNKPREHRQPTHCWNWDSNRKATMVFK